jgi:hypothetical protein
LAVSQRYGSRVLEREIKKYAVAVAVAVETDLIKT